MKSKYNYFLDKGFFEEYFRKKKLDSGEIGLEEYLALRNENNENIVGVIFYYKNESFNWLFPLLQNWTSFTLKEKEELEAKGLKVYHKDSTSLISKVFKKISSLHSDLFRRNHFLEYLYISCFYRKLAEDLCDVRADSVRGNSFTWWDFFGFNKMTTIFTLESLKNFDKENFLDLGIEYSYIKDESKVS